MRVILMTRVSQNLCINVASTADHQQHKNLILKSGIKFLSFYFSLTLMKKYVAAYMRRIHSDDCILKNS